MIGVDPGKANLLFGLRASLQEVKEGLREQEAGGSAGEEHPGRFITDGQARKLLTDDRDRFQLRAGAHQRFKGRDKGTRFDLRRRKRTDADKVLAAMSVLARGEDQKQGGWSSPDPRLLALLWNAERKADGPLREPRQGVNPYQCYADQVRDHAPVEPDKVHPGSPAGVLASYHFGDDFAAAKAGFREACQRRRHEAVTANRVLRHGPPRGAAAAPTSTTRRIR